MTSGVFDNAIVSMLTGQVHIQENPTTTYCILASAAPDKANDVDYGDVKYGVGHEIATVNGYSPLGGGPTGVATVAPSVSSSVVGLKASAPLVFNTTGTLSCTHAYIQYAASLQTTNSNPLLCYLDVGTQSVTVGSLTFYWNAAGIMTISTV